MRIKWIERKFWTLNWGKNKIFPCSHDNLLFLLNALKVFDNQWYKLHIAISNDDVCKKQLTTINIETIKIISGKKNKDHEWIIINTMGKKKTKEKKKISFPVNRLTWEDENHFFHGYWTGKSLSLWRFHVIWTFLLPYLSSLYFHLILSNCILIMISMIPSYHYYFAEWQQTNKQNWI